VKKQPTMQRFPLDSPWQERIHLDDGREIRLRPIAPEDAEPIRAGFSLLSPDEVRSRYLHAMNELSEDYLHALTHPQPGRDFVLVLAEPLPPGEALIGAVARLSVQPGTRNAEFAILVSRFLSGQGLGRLLLKKLIEHAKRRRLQELQGDVLEDNIPMLKLAQSLGFHRETGEASGSARIRLPLRGSLSDSASMQARPDPAAG
jgi:RimJ/RimL family protein N-acetyltransferase